jgi:hypothetical protein
MQSLSRLSARAASPLALLALLAAPGPAGAANPLGAGLNVIEVAAPPTLVEGVRKITVKPFTGTGGEAVAAELKAGFADTERQVGIGTAGDVAAGVLKLGSQIGGQMIASKIPGLGGKIASGAAEAAGGMAAEAVRGDKITLDDGLTVELYSVVSSGADATLSGQIKSAHQDKAYTKTETVTDKDGNVVKDSNGNAVTQEIACTRRTVTATVTWSLDRAKGGPAAQGELQRDAADDKCAPDQGKLASVESLTKAAVGGAGAAIVAQITPAWRSYRVGLKREPHLAAPLRAARDGRHADALCLFHHMTGLDPADGAAALNLGALHEALGHHDAALAAYEKAAATGGPAKMAAEGKERVGARKAEVAGMLKAYDLTWKVPPPDLAACPRLPEGRPALLKSDQKVSIDGAEVELEKGELVFVTAEADKTATVTLLDGRSAQLPAKALK